MPRANSIPPKKQPRMPESTHAWGCVCAACWLARRCMCSVRCFPFVSQLPAQTPAGLHPAVKALRRFSSAKTCSFLFPISCNLLKTTVIMSKIMISISHNCEPVYRFLNFSEKEHIFFVFVPSTGKILVFFHNITWNIFRFLYTNTKNYVIMKVPREIPRRTLGNLQEKVVLYEINDHRKANTRNRRYA